jgi:DNA-binding transcriptional ArsR family regulator
MADEANEVFAALADPTRWQVLSLLAEGGGGTATTIAAELPVSRPAVVKHLGVLDRAGLVQSRREGREVRYEVRPERLDETARWMAQLASRWDDRLAALKRLAEEGRPDGGRPGTRRRASTPSGGR